MAVLARRLGSALLLAVLGGALAERLGARPGVERRSAAVRGPAKAGRGTAVSRRARLASSIATLLLAGPVRPQQGQDAVLKQMFDLLDTDRSGLMSRDEYMAAAADMSGMQQIRYLAVFSQADIDDDDSFSMFEFDFASRLAQEGEVDELHASVDQFLPLNFRLNIDRSFDKLRENFDGRITLGQVMQSLRTLLLIEEGEEVNSDFKRSVIDMYDRANIINDGALNLNELDYLHFIVRDDLVSAALEDPVVPRPKEELVHTVVRDYFAFFDENGDGLLEKGELVQGLVDALASVVDPATHHGVYVELASALFDEANADGDGGLNKEEMSVLIDLITKDNPLN
mmetsp:Transcript_1294/g.3593  ORF Transcript_1294/g.3593 Transcript_1294/m.3593 type:complete len:342 (+) Transcript_1294:58-1083(+)